MSAICSSVYYYYKDNLAPRQAPHEQGHVNPINTTLWSNERIPLLGHLIYERIIKILNAARVASIGFLLQMKLSSYPHLMHKPSPDCTCFTNHAEKCTWVYAALYMRVQAKTHKFCNRTTRYVTCMHIRFRSGLLCTWIR